MDSKKYLEDVMHKLDNINYGWLDIANQVHINSIDDYASKYRVASFDEVLKYHVGSCFDQVELERTIFQDSYITKSFGIFNKHMVHTFIVLQKEDAFIYFEHSSYSAKGIYYFDNLDALLDFALNSFMLRHHVQNKSSLKMVCYEPLRPNMTFEEIRSYFATLPNIIK